MNYYCALDPRLLQRKWLVDLLCAFISLLTWILVWICIILSINNFNKFSAQYAKHVIWHYLHVKIDIFSLFKKYCKSDHQLCLGEGQWEAVLQRNTLLFCIMTILWSQIIIWLRVHHAALNVSLQMVFFFWEMCHPLLWCILILMAKCQCQISLCLHMICNFMMRKSRKLIRKKVMLWLTIFSWTFLLEH